MFPLFQLILLQRLIETLSPLGEGNRCRWSGRQWLRKTDGRPRPCLDLALNDGRVAARERNIVLVGGASVSAVREHERDARVARTGPPFAVIILCPTHLLCSGRGYRPGSRERARPLPVRQSHSGSMLSNSASMRNALQRVSSPSRLICVGLPKITRSDDPLAVGASSPGSPREKQVFCHLR